MIVDQVTRTSLSKGNANQPQKQVSDPLNGNRLQNPPGFCARIEK